ncbi:V-type ATP synthase subunit I [Halosimplex pelagicum]|uniref:A-type ATP synthase subunit I n=2 Tax=Halosimplex pelagicum TaxID=869886 RepID=A0A7D5PDQ6_9EURY|nr:V-type ATP synthase subunit I [Halosimplex pelagicum]
MFRPKRMSKVSVTGSKAVMDDVIETVHDLHLVHFNDYDGRWEGFDNGNPMEGGDEASEKLVTVRSLKSILGVEPEDAGPSRIVTDETLETELEEVRTEANELDDERTETESELREVEEEIGAMDPFATLGIDLDLLWGYDSLSVAVGEGDADSVERALADLDAATQVFAEDGVVAAFARTDEDALQSAVVEADFTAIDVPHEEGDPQDVLAELEHREQKLESKLDTVEDQLEDLRYDVAGFLLAAEEKLSIRARKAEAPLSFATTENAFVAEGWIPSERTDEFERALADAVDDHVDVEELEVAEYDRHGHAATTEAVDHTPEATGAGTGGVEEEEPSAAAEEDEAEPQTARTDGGTVTMGGDDDPPVIQDNSAISQPFELLTKAVGRPNYSEFDPTLILFLTFPLMFGFIIGDVGYGLIYTGVGYYMIRNFDSDAFKNFGVITAVCGISTAIFGFLYGEIFGLHLVASQFWEGVVGLNHAPIEKGLSPATSYWANTWFLVTALFGLLHLNTAYVLEFVENVSLHGVKEAILETGSWLLALNGLWIFIFSRLFSGAKPDLLFETFDEGHMAAFELGFAGFPVEIGWVGLGMVGLGMALLAIGPVHELIEIHVVLAHTLSYLRIAAVLLAKAGMAFAVNLLFWGAYEVPTEYGAEWHFMLTYGPQYALDHYEGASILFPGMVHMGPAMAVFGVFVLIVGNLVVLILGVTSSGIQSIRLEFFEFFEKFYEGNGTAYQPFGTERTYTADDQS